MDNFDSIYFSRYAIDPDLDIAGIDLSEDYSLSDDEFFEKTYDKICLYDRDDEDSFQTI